MKNQNYIVLPNPDHNSYGLRAWGKQEFIKYFDEVVWDCIYDLGSRHFKEVCDPFVQSWGEDAYYLEFLWKRSPAAQELILNLAIMVEEKTGVDMEIRDD